MIGVENMPFRKARISVKYDYYIFDFDGTLAETGEGIRRSVAYSLEKMGREVPGDDVLNCFIGPPLFASYVKYFNMTDEEAEEAVRLYREHYVPIGLYQSYVYPGIAALLRTLAQNGAWVAVASGKPEVMVKDLAAHFGIDKYMNKIAGISMEYKDVDKQHLILRALPEGADLSRACMVGDRCFDIDAAKALGMDAIGVSYGYAPEGELERSGSDKVFADVPSMMDYLCEGMTRRGLFISMEGSDGCGKSTQLNLAKEYLGKRGYETIFTREPGGCPISEKIREVILSLDSVGMSAECEALLYAASRVEHMREVIEPALKLGKIVICDRFLDSSIAYQAFGRELGEDFIRQINAPAVKEACPDVTVLLEVDREAVKKRMADRAPLDRLEIEKEDFFQRVQAGYDAIALAEPDRVKRIDAGRTIEEVFEDVRCAIENALAVR